MDLSESAPRRAQRAVLALTVVAIAALAVVGITAPGAIRGALTAPEVGTATTPAPYFCLSMDENKWVCNGTPEAPRPGLPLG